MSYDNGFSRCYPSGNSMCPHGWEDGYEDYEEEEYEKDYEEEEDELQTNQKDVAG